MDIRPRRWYVRCLTGFKLKHSLLANCFFDQMYGIRKDKVEVVWPITGRGKSQ